MQVTKVSVMVGALCAAAMLTAVGVVGAAPAGATEARTTVAPALSGGASAVGVFGAGAPALAAGATLVEPTVPRESSCGRVPPSRHREWLDGFGVGWLPPGRGALVSDFAYEWEDVGFLARVWESGPDGDGAYRRDLQVTVMRSATFTDADALHAFLAEYHEEDPDRWAREAFQHPDGPGFRTGTEVFWLAQPGVAVRVSVDGERFSGRDLIRTACDVRQVMAA
ncbi:hypothetical protein [Jiangella asiatica]|uniref:DUF3558 domain-containing protein n=1 Tax=Jiangella asiatica TaxID=2530372 RepID=A0A4R5C746_9ACTN|nr:hypothetical protein [Jiangella asiatica]TDD94529.1 hypothetical protein E1269_31820 [Jiangella asiatica]